MQVIASVLRNLSWRADVNSKKTLREVGSVKALMECALEVKKVSLKIFNILIWILSLVTFFHPLRVLIPDPLISSVLSLRLLQIPKVLRWKRLYRAA